MELSASGFGDDVDCATGAGSVLSGEAVVQDGHFLDREKGQVGEDRLTSPAIVPVGSIDFEPRLAATGAIGGEHVFVHEDVALVDGLTVGGVKQRQVGDASIQERSLFHSFGIEAIAQLWPIGANFADGPGDGNLRLSAGGVELQFQIGGCAPG